MISIALAGTWAGSSLAAESCTGFKWDVGKEHALFAGPSVALRAAKDVAAAPSIGPDRLYALQLTPQTDVAFSVPPGKRTADGAFAGLATLALEVPGNYRVAVDVPLWIDVIVDGKLATVRDYQGQQLCDAPHKIVEFDLSGAKQFVLQLSGSQQAAIRLTVTRAPVAG